MSNALIVPQVPVRVIPLWITDDEVRRIFRNFKILYRETDGHFKREADGRFVREQRSKEGTLGYVFCNPLDGTNSLWVISKKTRQPFKLARVG